MTRPRRALGAFALVRDSFRLLFTRFRLLFVAAFLPALGLAAFAHLAGTGEPVPLDPVTGTAATGAGTGALFVGFFLDVLIGFFVSGTLTLAAVDAELGSRDGFGAYVRQTLRCSGPILVLGTVLYVLAGVGLALFVLPGLYVLARFLPWLAVIVFEDAGWSGLTRAQELTEGERLPLAGAITLLVIIGVGAAFLLAPVVALAASAGAPALVLLEAAGTALYYAMSACFTAVAFIRLRTEKEAAEPADLAAGAPWRRIS